MATSSTDYEALPLNMSEALPRDVSSPPTLAERAAQLLQRAIITGEIEPGAKLNILKLAQKFDIGATPVREALVRLVGTGLVYAIGQSGFRAAPMSRADLEDLIEVRNMVELEALRQSITHGDDEWEARMVTALYRLNKLEQSSSDADEGQGDFDLAHKAFHHALLSACGSPRLLALHSSLYDQAYRYRRAMVAGFRGQRPHNDQHQRLSELALARKADECCALMREHLASTFRSVYGEVEAKGATPAAAKRRAAAKRG